MSFECNYFYYPPGDISSYLLLRPKYYSYVLETSCVCYASHFLPKLAENPIKIVYS